MRHRKKLIPIAFLLAADVMVLAPCGADGRMDLSRAGKMMPGGRGFSPKMI
jgi:hypothetical protein